MENNVIEDKKGMSIVGWYIFPLLFLIVFMGFQFHVWVSHSSYNYLQTMGLITVILAFLFIYILSGLYTVQPNHAVIFQFFGDYVGTVKETGFLWAWPFYNRKKISMRIRNFETQKIKVNDNNGNPIEVASIIVWKVADAAKAIFEVDNYHDFVLTQSEAALRGLVMRYPYEAYNDNATSLIKHTEEVSVRLKNDVQIRLAQAGVEILEARLSHLAYSQEIAASMLQRQQADAIVAARTKIVEGAVGMVESALELIHKKNIVEFDEAKKAQMVSNLLVVLCSEQGTQPVIEASN